MDWGQVALLAGMIVCVGAIAGVTAGLLGVGGGIVIVPVLFHLFTQLGVPEEVRMHTAVGTSLGSIILTSMSSVRAHHRRGAVDIPMLRSWGPIIFVGVIIGTALAGYVKGEALTAVFAVIALIVSLHMAFGKKHWRVAEALPTGVGRFTMAGFIGTFSAMMGIGGGTLSVPLFSLFGYPIHRAVGTAAAIGFIIGIPGTIGFIIAGWGKPDLLPFSLGYVNLIGLALIAPLSILCAPYGARLAHAMDMSNLKRAFAAFLGLTALRMFYALLT
jgi:uncharacterized membrane protein YfcA